MWDTEHWLIPWSKIRKIDWYYDLDSEVVYGYRMVGCWEWLRTGLTSNFCGGNLFPNKISACWHHRNRIVLMIWPIKESLSNNTLKFMYKFEPQLDGYDISRWKPTGYLEIMMQHTLRSMWGEKFWISKFMSFPVLHVFHSWHCFVYNTADMDGHWWYESFREIAYNDSIYTD